MSGRNSWDAPVACMTYVTCPPSCLGLIEIVKQVGREREMWGKVEGGRKLHLLEGGCGRGGGVITNGCQETGNKTGV